MTNPISVNVNIFKEYLEEIIPKGKHNKIIIDHIQKFLTSSSEKSSITTFNKIYTEINKGRESLFHFDYDFFMVCLAQNENVTFLESVNKEFANLFVTQLKKVKDVVSFTNFYFQFKGLYLFVDPFQYVTEKSIEEKLLGIKGFERSTNTIKGILELKRENTDNALNILATALYFDSIHLPALYELGHYHFNLNNYRLADSFFRIILSKEKKDPQGYPDILDIYFSSSICAIKLKDYKRSEGLLKAFIKIQKDDVTAYNNLAYTLNRLGKYEEALKYSDKGISIDQTFDNIYFIKAQSLKKTGKYKAARDVLNELKKFSKAIKSIQKELDSIKKWQSGKLHLKMTIEDSDEEEIGVSVTSDKIKQTVNKSDIESGSILKEKFLEDFLESRINSGKQTFGRHLKIFSEQYYGRQYPIPHGRIDLLCEDEDTNELIVIELKKDGSDTKVVDQILNYMDYVGKAIAKNKRDVTGIICLNSPSKDLIQFVRKYPAISIQKYSFHFENVE